MAPCNQVPQQNASMMRMKEMRYQKTAHTSYRVILPTSNDHDRKQHRTDHIDETKRKLEEREREIKAKEKEIKDKE